MIILLLSIVMEMQKSIADLITVTTTIAYIYYALQTRQTPVDVI